MIKLSAFWRNHRLGMFYGALWSLVPMVIFEQLPGTHYWVQPRPIDWGICLAMLGSSLTSAILVTWLFRKLLIGKTAKALFIMSPLALLVGAALYGFFFAQFLWILRKQTETWVEITWGWMWLHAFMACVSLYAIGLIPLAGLNTWDLWRRVNRDQTTKTSLP
jgi:hypothetical protein